MEALIDSVLDSSGKKGAGPGKTDNYYTLLGCGETASDEQLRTEYLVRARQLHPDKQATTEQPEAQGTAAAAQDGVEEDAARRTAEFAQLQQAYRVLSNKDSRAAYDAWLRSGIRVSFERWQQMGEAATSLHFASRARPPRAIAAEAASDEKAKRVAAQATDSAENEASKRGKDSDVQRPKFTTVQTDALAAFRRGDRFF